MDIANYTGQIVPMILQRMKVDLESKLVLNVPDDDPTQTQHIEIGKFQENPIKQGVYVALLGGDPASSDFVDGRIDSERLDDIEISNLPVGEIGGGEYWWRRGTVTFGTFFIRNNYEEVRAMMYAYDFYARLLKAVEETSMAGLRDDYGEKASRAPLIESSSFNTQGGAKQWIWRGKLYWRVLTWRP